jgi:hypothetical protein
MYIKYSPFLIHFLGPVVFPIGASYSPKCEVDPRELESLTASQDDQTVLQNIQKECEGVDETFLGGCKIPNMVHMVWYSGWDFRFDHYISLKSIRVALPDAKMFIHGREFPHGNDFFERSQTELGLILVQSRVVEKVYGREVTVLEHKTDVIRFESLLRFGGMYFDTDVLLVRPVPLNFWRELTVVGPEGSSGINSGVIFSKRCAPFVRKWYEGYRNYLDKNWGYNAIIVPYQVWTNLPEEERQIVKVDGEHIKTNWVESPEQLFNSNDRSSDFWQDPVAIHMFIRLAPNFKVGEKEAKALPNNYGFIVRNLLDGKTALGNPLDSGGNNLQPVNSFSLDPSL